MPANPLPYQAVKTKVKTAEFRDLTIFRQHVRDKVSELHAQMNMCWDTQALHEGRLQHTTTPEKRAIQEMIDNKANILSLVRSEVRARRRAVVPMKWGGSAPVTMQHVSISQNLQHEQVPCQSHNNIRHTTMSSGGHLGRRGEKRIEGGTKATGQVPDTGMQAQTLSGAQRPLSAMESQSGKNSMEVRAETNLETKRQSKRIKYVARTS